MSVKIIVDSASDLSLEEAKNNEIIVLPLKTLIDGKEYRDGIDITAYEFYEKLEECDELPTTSQVSPAEFIDVYESVVSGGDEAVVITLSSVLSGTYQSAVIALEGYEDKIHIVDSLNVAVGQQILIRYAMRLRDEGYGAKAIADELEKVKGRVCLLARVDTLEYLMKGGRVSKSAAIVGGVLNIKPVVTVEEGAVVVVGKARGSKMSNNLLNQTIDKKGGIDFSMPAMLVYSGLDDALLKGYVENCRNLWEGNIENLPVTVLGSTVGTHVGPGAIGVAFFVKE